MADRPPPLHWDGQGESAVADVKDQAEQYRRWLLSMNGELPANCIHGDGVCKAMIKEKVLVPTGKWSSPKMHRRMAENFRSDLQNVVVYVQNSNP